MVTGKTIIIPSSSLHTGAQVAPLLKRFNLRSFMTVPVILQELVELDDPETMKALQNLDFIACAGGALKESIGERLAESGVKFLNSFGTTEAGPLSAIYVPSSDHDWRWITLRKDMPIDIAQEVGPKDLHRNNRFRLSVQVPGWTQPFEMQDLFAMNPADATKRQFRPLQRTDDVIVLKNGEKVSPYHLESVLSQRDDVRGAIVFGNGQSQLGVLVEPRQPLASPNTIAAFKESILGCLSEAGSSIDAHARIVFSEAIVVLQQGQSLPRSDKGELLRRACYEAYSQEIEHAYELLSSVSVETDNSLLKGDVEENLQQLIKTQILRPGQSQELTRSTDLFELGLDSLQAMQLRQILFSSLVVESGDCKTAAEMVPRGFVYLNPTISKMTGKLTGKLGSQTSASKDEIIQQYVQEYFVKPHNPEPKHANDAVILLTGASGGLGSHILAQLVANDTVKHVICLNRLSASFPDPCIRQYSCSSEKGADIPNHLRSKIEVLDTNLSLPGLGLEEAVYARLADIVTHIVHNAWPLDFNRQISSFRAQFQALSNLIRFCLDAKTTQSSRQVGSDDPVPVRLLFVSSISVVGLYNHGGPTRDLVVVPEYQAVNAQHTLPLGYAEAKLVCEMMLHNATQAGIVNGITTRLGQISGAMKNGYWNTSEHIPTMFQTSVQMGALPQMQGVSNIPFNHFISFSVLSIANDKMV
jgi:thioester reductase-like protein